MGIRPLAMLVQPNESSGISVPYIVTHKQNKTISGECGGDNNQRMEDNNTRRHERLGA